MKRSGFTMIELIFVIVILGILAAVAIPKLAATRDDAKIATKVQEGTQFLNEMSAYYTSKGSFAKVADMSNVKLSSNVAADVDAGASDMNATATVVYLTDGKGVGCISFTSPTAGSIDGNVTVISLAGASSICKGVEAALNDKNISAVTPGKVHHFGGSNVAY